MLFYENLEEIVFTKHELVECDELIILSGYVGPAPVERLRTLPITATVIYGMYGSDGISANLHNSLLALNHRIASIDIKYSPVPIHSKCYAWKQNGQIVHALIGSANFSANGLRTPFKEILAETTRDTFAPLNAYIDMIISNSIQCEHGVVRSRPFRQIAETPDILVNPEVCAMVLYDPKTGEVQKGNGLNWGMAEGSHVHKDDANIPIRTNYLRSHPTLFPKKTMLPRLETDMGKIHRHNDAVEIIWDDGTTMLGLLEGNYPIGDSVYPKQICSFPHKRILGQYIRNRIGVPSGCRITRNDLRRYGRDTIDISLQGEGIYYFDFSVSQ